MLREWTAPWRTRFRWCCFDAGAVADSAFSARYWPKLSRLAAADNTLLRMISRSCGQWRIDRDGLTQEAHSVASRHRPATLLGCEGRRLPGLCGPPGEWTQWRERNCRDRGKSVVRTERSGPSRDFASSPRYGCVLFHFRPLLYGAAPDFTAAIAPLLDRGAQGVDLFFILSGFVLDVDVHRQDGRSWSTRATLRFLWLRLARVWPVYLVTLHLAALWIIFTLNVGTSRPENVGQADGDQLRPPALLGATVVPAVLRRIQLGRTGLVDQRRMAGAT